MNSEEKRQKLLKRIINSDDAGITKIYAVLENKSSAAALDEESFIKIMAVVAGELCADIEGDSTALVLLLATYCMMLAEKIYH